MLTEHADSPAAHRHPLEDYVPDPAGLPPLCGEREFARILAGMVADAAPRLFAIVQEYGDRVDAHIAAWGVAFEERATVITPGENFTPAPHRAAGVPACLPRRYPHHPTTGLA